MSKKYEIEALDDFVVVKFLKGSQSKGGIALPDMASEGYRFYVVHVGPGCKRKDLNPGDEVMLAAARGHLGFSPPAHLGMDDHLVIHESHVCARLREKE